MEQPMKIQLHIVSPVHIGCDEVYEPTGFFIDDSSCKLVSFDSFDFIKGLKDNDRAKFADLCLKGTIGSIPEIYDFICRQKPQGRRVAVAQGLMANYKRVRSLAREKDERRVGQELNKFAISRTAFNPFTHLPFVPGSSLKGAFRTAWLNKLAIDGEVREWKAKSRELEAELLAGSFDTDPFRLVKVSDLLPADEMETRILYAVNKKKRVSKMNARGPSQILEVVQPGALFRGSLSVMPPPQGAKILKAFTADDLLNSLVAFYKRVFDLERSIMSTIGADVSLYDRALQKFNGSLGRTAFPVRLGRHSGAEAVTIEGNRDIKIMQGRGKDPEYAPAATTLWLASESGRPSTNTGLQPFGWAIIEVVDEYSEPESVKRKRQAEAEKEQQRIREEQERAEQERLASMSEDERLICLIENGNIIENDVVRLFQMLDSLEETKQKNAAESLKKYWQKHSKWDSGKLSPKQKKKVERAKTILGE